MELHSELLKKREDVGLTQKELAKKLGMSSAQLISNWERGVCDPPIKKLHSLSVILKTDFDALVSSVMNMKVQRARQKALVAAKKSKKVTK